MRELSVGEVQAVSGGIIPAVAAGFMAYNYVAAAYGAAHVAAYAAGAATVTGIYISNK